MVAIPYDAKSQFYPQLVFLARSLAAGQSPFWTPNVFAGWPQIADPQSLIFSPFHVAVALLAPAPSPWLADAMVFALLFAGGLGVILLFRDRGWHVGGALVAALAFAFGGSAASRIQHDEDDRQQRITGVRPNESGGRGRKCHGQCADQQQTDPGRRPEKH